MAARKQKPRTRDIGTNKAAAARPLASRGDLHVLFIGINEYKHWDPLRTAVKDARAVRDVLVARYGLQQANIKELYDESATADNIDLAPRAYAGSACAFYRQSTY